MSIQFSGFENGSGWIRVAHAKNIGLNFRIIRTDKIDPTDAKMLRGSNN